MRSHQFFAGIYQGKGWNVLDIPDDFEGHDAYAIITARLKLTAAYAGGQSTPTDMVYGVAAKNQASAVTWVDMFKTFSSADTQLTATDWVKVKWIVPASAFVGKEGGKLQVWFFVQSGSTGPDLLFGEIKGMWEIEKPEPASGFAFA